jgi:hypothetical protein
MYSKPFKSQPIVYPTNRQNRSLIHTPNFCHVNKIIHSKQMIHKHCEIAKSFCSEKNNKGYYSNASDECVTLWNEILDYAQFLEEQNELYYEEFSDLDEFLESLWKNW